jgi:hypothetical protein
MDFFNTHIKLNISVTCLVSNIKRNNSNWVPLFNYQIPQVKGELIADVAKTLANSGKPLKLKELAKCFEGQYSEEYVRRAAVACSQIGLATYETGVYTFNESERNDLKRATKSELYITFRKRLQDYTPFLLYVDFLSKEYSFNLENYSLEEIWENKFEEYRLETNNLCEFSCKHHDNCRGDACFISI